MVFEGGWISLHFKSPYWVTFQNRLSRGDSTLKKLSCLLFSPFSHFRNII